MPEIIFTRAGANGTQLSRAHAPGWSVEAWRDEPSRPIVLHRHSHDRSTHTSLYMTPAQARALAHELLHAADVAQPAAAQPKPKQQSVDSVTLGAAPKVTDQAPKVTDHFRDATKMVSTQLPEPVAIVTDTTPREPGWKTIFVPDAGTKLYTEQQVRQLLESLAVKDSLTPESTVNQQLTDHLRGAAKMMIPTAQVLEPVEQRQLDIGKAIERACQELPEGAEIQIYLERGASTVHMTDWDGNEFDHFDEDHDDFACRINAATDGAIAAEQVAAHVKQGGAAS